MNSVKIRSYALSCTFCKPSGRGSEWTEGGPPKSSLLCKTDTLEWVTNAMDCTGIYTESWQRSSWLGQRFQQLCLFGVHFHHARHHLNYSHWMVRWIMWIFHLIVISHALLLLCRKMCKVIFSLHNSHDLCDKLSSGKYQNHGINQVSSVNQVPSVNQVANVNEVSSIKRLYSPPTTSPCALSHW